MNAITVPACVCICVLCCGSPLHFFLLARTSDEPQTSTEYTAGTFPQQPLTGVSRTQFGGADAAVAALDDALAQPRAELSVAQLVRKAAAETRKRCASALCL